MKKRQDGYDVLEQGYMDTFCHKCVSERSVQQDASVFYLHAGYANVQLTVRPNFLRLRGEAAKGKLSYVRD